jgi:hypothetical protein
MLCTWLILEKKQKLNELMVAVVPFWYTKHFPHCD